MTIEELKKSMIKMVAVTIMASVLPWYQHYLMLYSDILNAQSFF